MATVARAGAGQVEVQSNDRLEVQYTPGGDWYVVVRVRGKAALQNAAYLLRRSGEGCGWRYRLVRDGQVVA